MELEIYLFSVSVNDLARRNVFPFCREVLMDLFLNTFFVGKQSLFSNNDSFSQEIMDAAVLHKEPTFYRILEILQILKLKY